MFEHFRETVSYKFPLLYNVAARKDIKTPVKYQYYISIKLMMDVHMQYIQFSYDEFAAETDVVLNIYMLKNPPPRAAKSE